MYIYRQRMLIPHRVRRGSESCRGLAHLEERTLRRCSVDVCRRRKRSRPGGKRAPVLYEPSPSPRWIGYIGRIWLQTSYYYIMKRNQFTSPFQDINCRDLVQFYIYFEREISQDNRPKSTPKRKAREKQQTTDGLLYTKHNDEQGSN